VKAAPNLGPLILDCIKPYKTGNYALWALGKVENIDKHKLLIPSIVLTGLNGVSITAISPIDGRSTKYTNVKSRPIATPFRVQFRPL
jgi:hypothetical protein